MDPAGFAHIAPPDEVPQTQVGVARNIKEPKKSKVLNARRRISETSVTGSKL